LRRTALVLAMVLSACAPNVGPLGATEKTNGLTIAVTVKEAGPKTYDLVATSIYPSVIDLDFFEALTGALQRRATIICGTPNYEVLVEHHFEVGFLGGLPEQARIRCP
jgi:hypothetical protein